MTFPAPFTIFVSALFKVAALYLARFFSSWAQKVRALYFERCAGSLPHLTHEIPMSAAFHYDSFRDYALAWLPRHDEAEAAAASEHAIRAFWKPLGGGSDVYPSGATRRSLRRRNISSHHNFDDGKKSSAIVSSGSGHRAWSLRSGLGAATFTLAHASRDLSRLDASGCNYATGLDGDPYVPRDPDPAGAGAYFGIDLSPLEVMFIKTNRPYRAGQVAAVERYSDWADAARLHRCNGGNHGAL